MSYTYESLLEEINKIPKHRRDSSITTFVDEDDTYLVISKEELVEEQSKATDFSLPVELDEWIESGSDGEDDLLLLPVEDSELLLSLD